MTRRIVLVPGDTPHAVLGPSSAHRWINCPASVRASAHIVDGGSQYAAEGTAAHAVAERCAREGVKAETFAGWEVHVPNGSGDPYVFTVDPEMVSAVQTFLDYVEEFAGSDFAESRVSFDRWVPEGFGTVDRARLDARTLHVFDFKYGRGVPVEAEENVQMKLYALGFLQTFEWMAEDIENCVLHIVQPRLDSITSWSMPPSDLLRWADETVAPAARETANPQARFAAGDWCQFCRIRATCMVRASSVFKEVVGDFDDLDAAVEKASLLGPAFALTNDEAARVLRVLPTIKAWCSDLEEYALAELMQGRPVGDWKLVEGRSVRAWAQPDEAVASALTAAGVHAEDCWQPRKIVTIAAAEKLLGKKHDLFTTLVTKPPGKPTLAPAEDRRPPLAPNALTEFDDISSESDVAAR